MTLGYWEHYFSLKEYVIMTDHESQKHIQSQRKVKQKARKWIEFLESFSYAIQCKKQNENVMVDALSKKICS